MMNKITIEDVITFTDNMIVDWYKDVLRDYGVKGAGKTHYNKKENEIVVEYAEDGVQKTWKMAFYPEYLSNGIKWVFRCWCELA